MGLRLYGFQSSYSKVEEHFVNCDIIVLKEERDKQARPTKLKQTIEVFV